MNAIPPPVQDVLDLFSSELTHVRFGDIDAETLSKATAAVQSAVAEVASAEALFADAHSRLQELQDALLQQVHRALAYARVYAEADVALGARLEAIALPRTTRRARGDGVNASVSVEPPIERRPRGRRRKALTAEPLLDGVSLSTAE